MSQNPFSPNYKSQLDLSDITRERKLSESRSASLEARRQSDDPEIRRQAEGTILGLPKKKPLNQPPKNARAVLPHEEDKGKSARLSRGRAI